MEQKLAARPLGGPLDFCLLCLPSGYATDRGPSAARVQS